MIREPVLIRFLIYIGQQILVNPVGLCVYMYRVVKKNEAS
jgi:hypothetical protein